MCCSSVNFFGFYLFYFWNLYASRCLHCRFVEPTFILSSVYIMNLEKVTQFHHGKDAWRNVYATAGLQVSFINVQVLVQSNEIVRFIQFVGPRFITRSSMRTIKALAELLQGNLVTLLINSNLLDADSSIIHLTQLKVIHHKHIDGNAYKLIAPVSPAPKPGSVYIATGGTLPSHHSSHNARHTAFVHFRSRHAYPLLARARLPGHRNRCRLPWSDSCSRAGIGFVCVLVAKWSRLSCMHSTHAADCLHPSCRVRQQRKVGRLHFTRRTFIVTQVVPAKVCWSHRGGGGGCVKACFRAWDAGDSLPTSSLAQIQKSTTVFQEEFGRILGGGAGSSATQEDEEQEGGRRGAAGGAGCPLQWVAYSIFRFCFASSVNI